MPLIILKYTFFNILKHFIKYQCVACKTDIQKAQTLCHLCVKGIDIIDQSSVCNKCGRYCLVDICYFCIHTPPVFQQAKAFCIYNEKSSTLIKHFKYYNDTLCEKFICEKVKLVLSNWSIIKDINIMTPVPMNWFKEYLKGYNHSAKLARNLAKSVGLNFLPFLLKKKFSFYRQALSSKKERLKNINGVFSIDERYNIIGKNILLIDDTITTGATVNECSRVLLQAGAKSVFVLTFAKSIKDEEIFASSN